MTSCLASKAAIGAQGRLGAAIFDLGGREQLAIVRTKLREDAMGTSRESRLRRMDFGRAKADDGIRFQAGDRL